MAQVLFIGVGGTGIRTLLYIKKMLLQNSPNNMLPGNVELLGVDTEKSVTPVGGINIGIDDAVVYGGQYGGQTSLAIPQEYVHVGANSAQIQPWVEGFDSNQLCRKWFNKEYFLGNKPEVLLNLTTGAGAYRQLGRLALFWELRQGENNSTLYQQLKRKIHRLVQNSNDKTISIVVVGSIAGGTGASMFMDLAHLSKKITREDKGTAKTYGFLVLPEAFQWTPKVTVDNRMEAHGFSALRELKRFLTLWGNDLGFEMNYTCETLGSHPVLASRSEGAIFSMVYLFGQRGQSTHDRQIPPLDVPIDEGVAPIIASWGLFLVDPASSLTFSSHITNHEAHVPQGADKVPAVVASTGVYTKVLPIESIIKRYELKLAKEVIDLLIPRDENGVPLRNNPYANEPVYRQMLGEKAGDTDIQDETKTPELLAEACQLLFDDQKKLPDSNSVASVVGKKVKDWQKAYKPQQTEVDYFTELYEEVMYFYNPNCKSFMKKKCLEGAIIPSIYKAKDYAGARNAADQWEKDLLDELEKLEIQWTPHIQRMKERRLVDFRARIEKRLNEFLNGKLGDGQTAQPSNAEQRYAARIVWARDYFRGMTNRIKKSQLDMESAKATQKGQLATLERELSQTVIEMGQNERKQYDYVEKFQQKWDIHRWGIFCQGQTELLKDALAFIEPIYDQLKQWVTILSDQTPTGISLLKSIDDGETAILEDRRISANLLPKVREVINDLAWEDQQYEEIWNAPDEDNEDLRKAQKVLHEWEWHISQTNLQNSPKLKIQAKLGNDALIFWPVDLTNDEEKLTNSAANRKIFGDRCKQEFDGVREKISVLDYYKNKYANDAQHYDPRVLMKEMFDKCDILLNATEGQVVYSADLAVHHATGDEYCNEMKAQLQTLYGNANESLFHLMEYEDRHTMSFIATVDNVPIENLAAYQEPKNAYIDTAPLCIGANQGRELHHVYAAEQEASRLDLLAADKDLIDHRVVGVMEDITLIQQIIVGLHLGIIEKGIPPWVTTSVTGAGANHYNQYFARFTGELDPFTGQPIEINAEFTKNDQRYQDDIPLIDLFENMALMTYTYRNASPDPTLTMAAARQNLEQLLEVEIREQMARNLAKWQEGNIKKPNNQAELAVRNAGTAAGEQHLIFATYNEMYKGFNNFIEERRRRINLPEKNGQKIQVPPTVINQELTLLDVLQKLLVKWVRP